MIRVRRSGERGVTEIGWLDSRHTFSFGDYRDPGHVHFRSLRVINEDRVAPRSGFPTHPHADMEIVTYVVSGALQHRDSMGNGSAITPGEVQRMTAGTGIAHSEMNSSRTDPVHLLQIWILPERRGLTPGYEQKRFPDEERRGRLRLVAARDGRDGAVTIHQDASLFAATLPAGARVEHPLAKGRGAWLQLIRGELDLTTDGAPGVVTRATRLSAGDGAAIEDVSHLSIQASSEAELLLFDLA
jgi:redox-sensitive bicupin YhaK (pirin superfamily)